MIESLSEQSPVTTVFDSTTVEEYYANGSWDDLTVADYVARNRETNPTGWAFRAPDRNLTWEEYDEFSTRLSGTLVQIGLPREALLGVLLAGGSLVHVVYLAAQKAGLITVGMGPRSGEREIVQLLERTDCRWLVTGTTHRMRDAHDLVAALTARGAQLEHHVTIDLDETGLRLSLDGTPQMLLDLQTATEALNGRGLSADELFFLNSTSGTTGLPKCVMATMNNRKYFGALAVDAAGLDSSDVFFSVLPSPYAFGLWSAHFVPAMCGATTVLCADFNAADSLRLIETERVTVLAAVTSQFIMMLNSSMMDESDLTSLRILFTGGEQVPRARAEEFERRTGVSILQFYGSNEAGPLSVTRTSDSLEHRLGTVGRPIPGQNIRLFDAEGVDVTAQGGPGQCAGRGPGTSPGYYADPEANAILFGTDGWLLTGDLATIDGNGYLALAGRKADFIIRGGHNISALEVEEEVGSHPRIAQVAALGIPDPVFGERVCVVVATKDGEPLDLDELRIHLAASGASKHHWPERIHVLRELPLNTGGKIDKARLRREIDLSH